MRDRTCAGRDMPGRVAALQAEDLTLAKLTGQTAMATPYD